MDNPNTPEKRLFNIAVPLIGEYVAQVKALKLTEAIKMAIEQGPPYVEDIPENVHCWELDAVMYCSSRRNKDKQYAATAQEVEI